MRVDRETRRGRGIVRKREGAVVGVLFSSERFAVF